MTGPIEQKLQDMGLALPVLPPSKGIYRPCRTSGRQVYVSGHVSLRTDGSFITGKLGAELDVAQGQWAARQCGLAMLVSLREHLGDLDRIRGVLKLFGMVNATPDFSEHALVINGCSELFAALWGAEGIGVRSAVGMGSLPGQTAVEIEGIFEL